jgi:hypothetical protein
MLKDLEAGWVDDSFEPLAGGKPHAQKSSSSVTVLISGVRLNQRPARASALKLIACSGIAPLLHYLLSADKFGPLADAVCFFPVPSLCFTTPLVPGMLIARGAVRQ